MIEVQEYRASSPQQRAFEPLSSIAANYSRIKRQASCEGIHPRIIPNIFGNNILIPIYGNGFHKNYLFIFKIYRKLQ